MNTIPAKGLTAAYLAGKYYNVASVTTDDNGIKVYSFPATNLVRDEVKKFQASSIFRDICRGIERLDNVGKPAHGDLFGGGEVKAKKPESGLF